MFPKTRTKLAPAAALPPPLPPEADAASLFAPSEELAEHLDWLEEAQAAIDRRKAEELARLREIQDRD